MSPRSIWTVFVLETLSKLFGPVSSDSRSISMRVERAVLRNVRTVNERHGAMPLTKSGSSLVYRSVRVILRMASDRFL